ncbi:hypothetical protein MDG893_13439 [Marinobacter algicola DG893]|uniref:Uncharacterized protein n=1 Tax=Marinobacter algicola DG893 TaxID=443152 RepID=A6F4P0_9GAMM|nr:hypothetical protein MDG893_13439 [Marinobacter algicola DG893]
MFVEVRRSGHQRKQGIGGRSQHTLNIAKVLVQRHLFHRAPTILQVETPGPFLQLFDELSGKLPAEAVRIIKHVRRTTKGEPGINESVLNKRQLIITGREGLGILKQLTGCAHGVAAIGQCQTQLLRNDLRPDRFMVVFQALGITISVGNTTVHNMASRGFHCTKQ